MSYKRKIGNIDGYMLTDAASVITLATMLIPKINKIALTKGLFDKIDLLIDLY